VGRVLRKTHLDELPQLLIVLFGDMSIVGPRPERPEFVEQLKDAVPNYEDRLCVKPGVTGLAQIHRAPDETVDDVRHKLRFDLLYLKNAGPWADIKIVVETIPLALGFSPGQVGRAVRLVLNRDPRTSTGATIATPVGRAYARQAAQLE
jgi:lipopolysaccharide/colanic/teichoic acid biosynthesis glycosyltransferase